MKDERARLRDLLNQREAQPTKLLVAGFIGGLAIVGFSGGTAILTAGVLTPVSLGIELLGAPIGSASVATQLAILDRSIREYADSLRSAIDRFDKCEGTPRPPRQEPLRQRSGSEQENARTGREPQPKDSSNET